jgi:O-antigen/teichoic acid export membrane protein
MLRSIKTSFKETIIYSFGNIAVKIVGLILIPLYTNPKYFTVDDFGVLGILEISALVITAFMASALPQSLVRWYWDDNFRDKQKQIFFIALSTQLVISILFCILLLPFSDQFSLMIFSDSRLGTTLSLVVISSALQAVNNILNTLMRLQTRSVLYSTTNLLKLAIVLLLTIYLVVSRGMGLEGIYMAQVIGNAIIVLMLAGYAVKNSIVYFDFGILRSMSSYSFPLLLANISAVILTVIDRFALNSLSVLKSVALYTLAFKITSVLKLVLVDSIKLAVGPMMIKRMYSPDNKRFYSKVLLYSSYVLMFAIVVISAYSYEAIKVLADAKAYWGAVAIIPLLSLSIFFVNMKEVTVYGLHIAKKTSIIGIIVIFSAVISLAFNILLIPRWDIMGAAFATLLTQLLYWLACYYFSQRVFPVPYENGKILLILIAGLILSFGCQLFNHMDTLTRLLLKTACVLSYPALLYLLKFYEPVELAAIKGFYNKWKHLDRLGENIKSLKNISDDF